VKALSYSVVVTERDPAISTHSPSSKQRAAFYCAAALIALCGLLYLPRAASLPLADPEESRCALIVRGMLGTGNWLMPHLQGRPYYDKPAPFFWLAAAGQWLTGSAELGGRIVASIAATAAVLVTFAFARRLGGNAAGLIAAAILATAPEFFFLARWYRMDMPFTALMWAALWWFWREESAGEGKPVRRVRQWVGFYTFAALATLMKGPAGVLLPAGVVTAYFLSTAQWRRLMGLFHPAGLAVYLLLAVPWYALVMLRYPQYGYQFFVVQNLSRYAGQGLGHRDFLAVYYLPILLGGFLPWTVYLFGAAARSFPKTWFRQTTDGGPRLLWLAAVLFFVFFSLSRTRLVSYILPVFPPLAVLTGLTLSQWACSTHHDRLYRMGARAFITAVAAFPPAVIGLEIYLKTFGPWSGTVVVAGGLFVVLQIRALWRDQRRMVLGWGMAGIAAVLLYAVLRDAPKSYEMMSNRPLGEAVGRVITPSDELVAWGDAPFSLALYAGRSATGRFQPHTPGDLDRLGELLRSSRTVYCLVNRPQDMDAVKSAAGTELFVLAKQGDAAVVVNRKPRD